MVIALFVLTGIGQEYVVPLGITEPEEGVTINEMPLHLTVVVNELIIGFGSTVTVKLKEVPAQEPVKVESE